jgi:hypothetical protein
MLTLKYVFLLLMSVTRNCLRSHLLSWIERLNMKLCMQLFEKLHNVTYAIYKKKHCSTVIQFSQCDISIHALVVLWYRI